MFKRTPLTPEQRLERDRERARRAREDEILRAERAEQRRIDAAARAERERERQEAFPIFIVRETREVSVKCEDMNDAIALASAAFEHGQDQDHTIKWHKPWGVDGDTIDKIRTVNIKAIESSFD